MFAPSLLLFIYSAVIVKMIEMLTEVMSSIANGDRFDRRHRRVCWYGEGTKDKF